MNHLVYCIDFPRKDEKKQNIKKIEGWMLCSQYIENIYLKINNKKSNVFYGKERNDVIKHYKNYPNNSNCGFSVNVNPDLNKKVNKLFFIINLKLSTGNIKKIKIKIDNLDNNIHKVEIFKLNKNIPFNFAVFEKRLKNFLKKNPSIIVRLDIINKCNLRCIMCHYKDDKIYKRKAKILTIEKFKKFFNNINKYVKDIMLSCGDEPLMSKYFIDIVSFLYKEYPHIRINLCTNAMLLSKDISKVIIQKNISCVVLSMDGATKKTLERIRKGSKYERIVRNIKILNQYKKNTQRHFPILIMNFVMMNSNIHETPIFIDLCIKLGIDTIDFRHVVPSEYFDIEEEMLINHKAKFNYYRNEILKRAGSIKIIIPPEYKINESWKPIKIKKVNLSDFDSVKINNLESINVESTNNKYSEINIDHFVKAVSCNRPFSEIMIIDQDIIKPCPWYVDNLGKLSEGKTLEEIFFGKKFKQARLLKLNHEDDPNCNNCPVKKNYLST